MVDFNQSNVDARTFSACLRRNSSIFSLRDASVMASISMARSAAFFAPSIATVATGMPDGICTSTGESQDRRESSP